METEFKSPVVSSFNEWDPLEEVIVGVLEGSCYQPLHRLMEASIHGDYVDDVTSFHKELGGIPRSQNQVDRVQPQLKEFIHIFEQEGVTVRFPEPLDQVRSYATMDWHSEGGNAHANPRDSMLVIGDEIIECPMASRSRFFEIYSYRKLLKEYFRRGVRWTAARFRPVSSC